MSEVNVFEPYEKKIKPIDEVLELTKKLLQKINRLEKEIEIIKKYHKEQLKEQLQKEIENECIVVEKKWWFQ